MTTLSPTGKQIYDYHVEVDKRGRYGVVWGTIFSGKPGVSFRLKRVSGGWFPPVVFAKGVKTWHPRVAVTSDGRWVVTWVEVRADRSSVVRAAVLGRDGTWARPTKIGSEARGDLVNYFDLRSDAHGRAVVTYTVDQNSGGGSLVGRTLNKDGTWAQATQIALPSSYTPAAALTQSGRVMVAVDGDALSGDAIFLAQRDVDGAWSPITTFNVPEMLADVGMLPTGPDSVQMHYVLWDGDGFRSLWWIDLAADGSHSEPAQVPGIAAGWTGPRSAVRAFPGRGGGGAVLAWGDRAGVHWLPRSTDGSWGTDTLLTSQRSEAVDAAMLADGRRVVVWQKSRIMRRFEKPDGSWSATAAISGRDSAGPHVAASPRGGYTAVWDHSQNYDLLLQATTIG